MWREKDDEDKPWLPLEIWQYILTFLRRKDLSSIKSHVASTGGAVVSREGGGRRSGSGSAGAGAGAGASAGAGGGGSKAALKEEAAPVTADVMATCISAAVNADVASAAAAEELKSLEDETDSLISEAVRVTAEKEQAAKERALQEEEQQQGVAAGKSPAAATAVGAGNVRSEHDAAENALEENSEVGAEVAAATAAEAVVADAQISKEKAAAATTGEEGRPTTEVAVAVAVAAAVVAAVGIAAAVRL